MKIQLIRHSTLIIYLNNKKILVDPMLSSKGSISPVPDVQNQNFNPLVELPVSIDTIINCHAILITHTHNNHFDDMAVSLLPKNIPIFCQPEDEIKIKSYGFNNVLSIDIDYVWNDITFHRTKGQHGHGEIAIQMSPVSGFVISSLEEPTIYIAGDTIFCLDVEESIEKFKPEIVICNCGSAQFSYGEPITMDAKDIHKLCTKFPNINVVAVHMEAWNHCKLSRKDLRHYITENNIDNFIAIPEDGEVLNYPKSMLQYSKIYF